jgi:hypothetical protein
MSYIFFFFVQTMHDVQSKNSNETNVLLLQALINYFLYSSVVDTFKGMHDISRLKISKAYAMKIFRIRKCYGK